MTNRCSRLTPENRHAADHMGKLPLAEFVLFQRIDRAKKSFAPFGTNDESTRGLGGPALAR